MRPRFGSDAKNAVFDHTLDSGLGFSKTIATGQTFRIVDLEGNQAVDTLFYDAFDATNRYSAVDTIREQGNVYLTTGTKLLSTGGDVLLTIVADTCGRHDTLGGACAYKLAKNLLASARDGTPNLIDTLGAGSVLLGVAVATLSAALAVHWLVAFLNRHGLAAFGWYRVALSAVIALAFWLGWVRIV